MAFLFPNEIRSQQIKIKDVRPVGISTMNRRGAQCEGGVHTLLPLPFPETAPCMAWKCED